MEREPPRARDTEPRSRSRRAVLGSLGAGAVVALAGCTVTSNADRETTTVSYTVSGSDVDEVAVSGGDGRTTVRATDGDAVRVEATKYAYGQTDLSNVTVRRSVQAGRLDVGADVPSQVGIGSFGGGLDSVTVEIPDGVRVTDVDVDDGEATIEDVAGDVALSVDDGEASVGPLDGALDVSVDDGDVTVGTVAAVGGDIDDGSLELTEATTLRDVSADDGDFDLAVDGLDGDATVETDDGAVEAALSRDLDATVVVHSDDGDVAVADGLLDELTVEDGTVRGRVGDGGDTLTVRADDADVELRAL
jgi:hypothetical protein